VRGEERGTTPIDLEMTRSDDPLAIEIAHPGYSPWSESVTLDADRTVDVWLSPARTAATRSAARAASMTEPTESAMSGSPFRRFR
jgi:hypothetical protein